MSEVVERVAKAAGIDEPLAERAVEIVFELVRDHGPADKVRELFSKLPDVGIEAASEGRGSGFLGSLGGFGGAMGAMAALNRLTDAGLSMEQIQTVAREVLHFSREHAGDELVGEVVGAIPGVSQFI